jgi:hypothetical protein
MTILKTLIGLLIGASAGYGYHMLMISCKSECINAKFPAVPIVVLGVLGAVIGYQVAGK